MDLLQLHCLILLCFVYFEKGSVDITNIQSSYQRGQKSNIVNNDHCMPQNNRNRDLASAIKLSNDSYTSYIRVMEKQND